MAIGDKVRAYQAHKAAAAAAEEQNDIVIVEDEMERRDDPDPVPVTAPSVAEAMLLIAQVLAELKAAKVDDSTAEVLKLQAKQLERLVNKTIPENTFAPNISVYTNPDGSKPALRCKTIVVGRELTGDTETVEEIELLNRLVPGEFRVTKADMTSIEFRVGAKKDQAGKLEEINVWFPTKGDHRHNHMPLASYMKQALGERIPSSVELLSEIKQLRAELALAKQGVVGVV